MAPHRARPPCSQPAARVARRGRFRAWAAGVSAFTGRGMYRARHPERAHARRGRGGDRLRRGRATGKFAVLAEMERWLGRYLTVERVHAGKPPGTPLTVFPISYFRCFVRSFLGSARPGSPSADIRRGLGHPARRRISRSSSAYAPSCWRMIEKSFSRVHLPARSTAVSCCATGTRPRTKAPPTERSWALPEQPPMRAASAAGSSSGKLASTGRSSRRILRSTSPPRSRRPSSEKKPREGGAGSVRALTARTELQPPLRRSPGSQDPNRSPTGRGACRDQEARLGGPLRVLTDGPTALACPGSASCLNCEASERSGRTRGDEQFQPELGHGIWSCVLRTACSAVNRRPRHMTCNAVMIGSWIGGERRA